MTIKLVRDKIPDVIREYGAKIKGCTPVGRVVDERVFIALLKEKLVEESVEVCRAQTTYQTLEELGDLYAVFETLLEKLGFTLEDIIDEARKKSEVHGDFDNGELIYLPPVLVVHEEV